MIWSQPVRALMFAEPICVDVSMAPSAVHAVFDSHPFHHLPVLDNGVLVGIISSIDVARVSLGAWVDSKTEDAWMDRQFEVQDIMSWEPEFVRDSDTLRTAANILSDGSFHALPVLDGNDKLVGILTSTDLLRAIANDA